MYILTQNGNRCEKDLRFLRLAGGSCEGCKSSVKKCGQSKQHFDHIVKLIRCVDNKLVMRGLHVISNAKEIYTHIFLRYL